MNFTPLAASKKKFNGYLVVGGGGFHLKDFCTLPINFKKS